MRSLHIAIFFFGFLSLKAQSSCDSLETLLNDMVEQYAALSMKNAQIAAEMDIQRMQIDTLRSTLQRGNYDLERARQEAKVLRSIMTGYLVTIDSLNSLNEKRPR
jgi:hypothetical protein